eukprot:2739034-Rhodomonas_salina.1
MERALHIAEEHMPRVDPSTMKTMRAAVPYADEHDSANGEKIKADLSPGEIRNVHTMLSQSGKAASEGGSQRSSGGKCPRNESQQERDKAYLPDCWKCRGKHPGADKGECRMFNSISAILDKKGVAGGSGAHKAMAAELMRLDREDRDCESAEDVSTCVHARLLRSARVPNAFHCPPPRWIGPSQGLADIAPSRAGTHTFRPEGPSMAVTASKDNILSHALLQKQGYKIMLRSGRPGDTSYGGEIVTPGGDVITLVFEDNMYRLPFPEQQEASRESKKLLQTSAVEHPIFAAPMTLPSLLSDEQRMQVAHNKWGHPLESTAHKNHRHHHGKSFP